MDFASADREEGDDLATSHVTHNMADAKGDQHVSSLIQPEHPPTDTPVHGVPSTAHDDADLQSDDDQHQTRLDPAWGIKRTDSAHILDGVRRSTSFPVMSPATDQLSQLDTQQILNDVSSAARDSPSALIDDIDTNPELEQPLAVVDTVSPVQDVQHTEGDTEEIRFDEGVPLIQHSEQPEQSLTSQVPAKSISDFETNGAEDSFFSQLKSEPVPHEEPPPQPPSLDRKDTVDVIGEMNFRAAVSDSPPQKPVSEFKEDDFFKADPEDAWAAALGDDEDEFLVEDADDLLSDSEPGSPDAFAAALREEIPPLPASSSRPDLGRQSSNAYAPHQPSTAELTHLSGAMYSNMGLGKPSIPLPQQQAANIVNRAESFVDQSKGGYKSPYDLPMDLAPKRRPQVNRVLPPTAVVPPPPRSSSISEKQLQSPFTPNAPGFGSKAPMSPPISQVSSPPTNRAVSSSVPPPSAAAPAGKRAPSSFFEELPMSSRPRPSPAPSRGLPNQLPTAPPNRPTAAVMQPPPPVVPQVQQPPQQQHSDPQSLYELRQPEKLDPYANVPLQHSITAPAVPAVTNRYSPAPPAVQNGIRPSPSPRYSPAPPPQGVPAQNRYASQPISAQAPLPFQPRTSSPLARQRRSVDEQIYVDGQAVRSVSHHGASSSLPAAASLPPPSAADRTLSPPRNVDPMKQPGFVPPHRAQTQSPSQRAPIIAQTLRMAERPASAFGQVTPQRTVSQSVLTSPPPLVVQRRRVAEEIDFIHPTDGSQVDPLQRWKGAPVVKFGFGGIVVRSTPMRIPRYTTGATRPQYKVSSGDVKQQTFAELTALPSHVSSFPGPLKGKSKKKEVLSWLSTHIAALDAEQASLMSPTQPLGDERKRAEEKLVLWKIIRVLVENDGNLDSPQALQAINVVLMPEVHALDEATATQYRGGTDLNGIYRPAGASIRSDTVDPQAVEVLRKHLLRGKRSDAVWHAVDTRMWSHALLLASTLDRSVWKQVVQEFVKQEVKTIGTNSESLSAVYEIFGGNMEESIDQLVPPSARAGLQMVSTIPSTGPSKNALDGLDRWRETLSLVLNNRTLDDQRALFTLARLLTDYGRIEAAHICLLFARSPTFPVHFGGVDDPAATIVLLGADHTHHPAQIHLNADAVLLTEVFDFAVSTLSSSSATNPMPHLAAFKLQRAYELAEAGLKTEALAYCDFIASGMGRSTKQSLYYNPVLLGEVEDLSNRLKQTPMQSSSWMAKPSIEKVSGSVWNKFSSFVTGEDSDAESKGSAREAAESAPFANVSGSPGPSRSHSQTDIYSSYPTTIPATAAASRYAPNGISSARSSTEMTRGRPSFEAQLSPPSTSHSNSGFNSYMPNTQTTPYSYGSSPSAQSHQPSPDPHMPSVAEEPATSHSYTPDLPQQSAFDPVQPTFGGYTPQQADDSSRPGSEPLINDSNPYAAPEQSYGGYQPPDDSGYVPYQPEPDSEDEAQAKPKAKKSFMDNDNDDNFRGASIHHNTTSTPPAPASSGSDDKAKRAANDAAADAAFRAAAEADAQREADAKKSKRQSGGGWLGGWFAGKKSDSLDGGKPAPTDSKKPVQVHLGESKMKLYYDKEKGKWINPDNPEASEKKAIAPPPRSNAGTPGGGPPFGGPPRSAPSPAIVGPPSRTGTPAGMDSEPGSIPSRPGSSSAAGPIGIGATLPPSTNQSLGIGGATPPSRPASALSSASDLDGLLGGPPTGARKVSGRGAGRGKKAGRYVDVMAK